jgi:L-fucose mutarotase/ribose pyranase (RbsD/FucU family)
VSIREGDLKFNETPADLTPKPLWAIAVMAHGGTRGLIDANYPADALHSRTLPPADASRHHPPFST